MSNSILVVDDDADIRATLAELLEDEGYRVGTAANGRDALAFLRDHPSTSLVLLDLMMPIMDGFGFLTAQRGDPAVSSIPVVVMTARGALQPGAIDVPDVLQKPLKIPQLLEAIRDVQRRRNGPAPIA